MNSSRGIIGRILRAASAQTVNQLARIAQLLITVPICLSAWGTAVYEDWVLLSSVVFLFFAFADLGFVQLITVRLIDHWAKGDRERFASEWGNALALSILFTGILGAGLGLFWMVADWTQLIPTRRLSGTDLANVLVLLSLAQIGWILLNFAFAVYRSRGDLSRGYHVSSVLALVQTAGIAAPVTLGSGATGAALGNAVVTIGVLALVAVDVMRRYQDVRWAPALSSVGVLRQSARAAIGYLVSPVTANIMLNGPNLILAAIGAPQGAIALFTTSRTVAGIARQLPYQFAHPAGIELASLLARGDRELLLKLYASTSRALAMVVGGVSGFTIAASPLALTLWTNGKVAYDPGLMVLLVGASVVCAPSQVAYTILWYGGHPKLLSKALVFSTVLAIALSLPLGKSFGVRGVALGLGIGEIVGMAFYLPFLAHRLLIREGGLGLLENFRIALLSFLSSAGVGYLMAWVIQPQGWQGLVELAFAWAIPAAAADYWFLVNAAQREKIGHFITTFVRSLRAKLP